MMADRRHVQEIITDRTLLKVVSLHYEEEEMGQAELDIRRLIEVAMDYPSCLGLSAIQIGLARQAFVFKDSNGHWMGVVNPFITKRFGGYVSRHEGCMSLPGVSVKVRRPKSITLVATVPANGEPRVFQHDYSGMTARIIQHEQDHLGGILIA